MISFSEVPGLEISLFLLLFIGLAVGIVAGFIGVGGGFIITPTLIVLGFPAEIAVGTGLAQITGTAVVATMRHRQLGNVDMRLGATMLVGSVAGVEGGVRFVNWMKEQGLADQAVLSASLALTGFIAVFTLWETERARRHLAATAAEEGNTQREAVTTSSLAFLGRLRLWPLVTLKVSRVRVSAWSLIGIGFVAGMLSGFIGVGGGFIMGPALIYLVGIPSHIVVGTDLLQIVFTAGYGTVRHTMSGNVLILVSFLMLLGSSGGTQIGALATRYVSGPAVRFALALALGFAALGTAFELADVLTDGTYRALDIGAKASLFGGLALLSTYITSLLVLGIARKRGSAIPRWARPLIVDD